MSLCCRFNVPDVDAACARFEKEGVQFVKKPNDGRMKGIAFIKVCCCHIPDCFTLESCPVPIVCELICKM